ncbi:BtrH N-terminal domain-containing protein [Breznakia pachnodae]|uniref:Butirosin biosynthesis protein H-like n=1 Tax=Breznakia pachnodae TaxID=265178 RepID=A0ABU0E201_9FIRM|nr:BtrH N-terminal domain-containing protein [Breznakia pachnodae]MDQ0360918.1 hypothetical protein [Breznakia pachnodae]
MKIIENFKHHKDDYECMWNGIEDIYMNHTGTTIPDQFFFLMSGFGGFAYIKTNAADIKRMVSFGDGRTKQMYQYLAPIVGFEFRHIQSKTFELAMKKAKKEIDNGNPVVLGALDMYYLEYYPKLYEGDHIPYHYVLMVGYDDEKECIYLYDCGKEDLQQLSYKNLKAALDVECPGMSKPNTICTIRMDKPADIMTIANTALKDKATTFISPPTGFLGYKGIQKLAKEFLKWDEEIGVDETKKIIKNMVYFMGTVPGYSNRLLGIDEPEMSIFMGGRDKMNRFMKELGEAEKNTAWIKAGDQFLNSGKLFEEMHELLVDYLLEISDEREKVQQLLLQIADKEKEAFTLVLEGTH